MRRHLDPSIDVTVDRDAGLVIFTVHGAVSTEVYCRVIAEQFKRQQAPDAIWDLRNADLSEMSADRLLEVAQAVQSTLHYRGPNPRTVFVSTEQQERILAKLYREISLNLNTRIAYHIVDSIAGARAWLDQGTPPAPDGCRTG